MNYLKRGQAWLLASLLLIATLAYAEDSPHQGDVDPFYGSFSTEIPIGVPAYHGLDPTLKLVYNSSGGDSQVGFGWSLAGSSFVERALPGGGTPNYDSNDGYFFEGTELVASTIQGGTHCTEIQNYTRIVWDSPGNRWLVYGTNGNLAEYATRHETSKGTYRWMLTSLTSPHGNVVNYSYWEAPSGTLFLDTISYNGNLITFYRESRPDPYTYATGADVARVDYRIASVDVQVGGQRARAYQLTYSNPGVLGRTHLVQVQQFGRDATVSGAGLVTGGTSLPPFTMSYADTAEDFQNEVYVGVYDKGAASSLPNADYADFNGDGLADMVYRRSGAKELRVKLSTGSGFGAETIWATYTKGAATSEPSVAFTDMDGDGKADFVYRDSGTNTIRVLLSNGSSFGTDTIWGTFSYGYAGSGQPRGSFVDMDGDGKTDVIYRRSSTKDLRVMLSTGTSLATDTLWGSYTYTTATTHPKPAFVDMNGDGNLDFIYRKDGTKNFYVKIASNGSFGADTYWGSYTYGAAQSEPNTTYADFNGDGKTDFAYKRSDTKDMYVMISDGSGFTPQEYWGSFTYGAGSDQPDGRFVDINGDSKTDILYRDAGTKDLRVLFSTGTSLGVDRLWATYTNGVGQSAPNVAFADFNGDGLIDYLYNKSSTKNLYLHLSRPEKHGLQTSVGNGIGGTTQISYTPSTAWANTYMARGLVLPTVTSLTTDDGRGNSGTVNYSYEGGLWSPEDKRFLGFRKVTSVLDAQGNYSETFYYQQVGSVSKPEFTYYYDNQGDIFSYSTYQYDYNYSPPYTSLLTDRWDYTHNLGDEPLRQLSQFAYDIYGNVTHTYEWGDYDLVGDEHTSVRGYVPNTANYLVGLPSYEEEYEGIGVAGELVLHTRYSYDNNVYTAPAQLGNTTKVEKWNSFDGSYVTVYRSYDSYGNVASQTDERGHVATTTYDPLYHIYPINVCDALGLCTAKTWDYELGRELNTTDANGALTQRTYDGVGRPLTIVQDDGGLTTYDYLDWGDAANQRTEQTRYDGVDELVTTTWQDGLGRTYQSQYPGDSNQEIIYSSTSSRVWQKSNVHGTLDTPEWTVSTYDGAGRLRTVTNPDASYSEIIYANDLDGKPYEATYDSLGNEKLIWKNAQGKITQIREDLGGSYAFTNYEYDALGNLDRIVDAAGNISTYVWDSLGRKLSSCDMDTGCSTFVYDDGGLLTSQTDAKNQVTSFTYDAIGRMTTRLADDAQLFEWFYDEVGHGDSQGRPTSIYYPGGSTSHSWDSRGNEISTTRCVEGTCETITQDYDTLGRVVEIGYPDGEFVTYGYDSDGRMNSVSGYVDQMTWSNAGQLTSMTYANGTSTSYTYDAGREWLNSTEVSRSSTTLFSATYNYDVAARMTGVTSTTNPLFTASYTYDNLNRLMTVAGGQSQSFSYDELGNMTYNSKVGTLNYDNQSHAHATSALAGSALVYDAAGNLSSGLDCTFTWDALHRLSSMYDGGDYSDFLYDEMGNRIRKGDTSGTTQYFGGLLERENGARIQYYYAGTVLVAKKEASGTSWFHADHLGSTRLLTDEAGLEILNRDYDPYGNILSSTGSGTAHRGFTGHQEDSTGLVFMKSRYYSTTLGRFLTPDSVVPDPSNPQAFNRYAYVTNNPITNIDPTGHAPVVAAVIIAATALATASPVIAAVAVVGAGLSVAGYLTKDPLLSSIGGIMLGVASGGLTGGLVAAATSPLSPLNPKVKQAIGWAYSVYGFIEAGQQIPEADAGQGAALKDISEKIQAGGGTAEAVKGLADNVDDVARWAKTFNVSADEMSNFLTDSLPGIMGEGNKLAAIMGELPKQQDFWGSGVQQLFGAEVIDKLGRTDLNHWWQGAILNPTGGLVGPGSNALFLGRGPFVHIGLHGITHDVDGFLKNAFSMGGGYAAFPHPGLFPSQPLSGQVGGLLVRYQGLIPKY